MRYEAKRYLSRQDVKDLKYAYDGLNNFSIKKLYKVDGVYTIAMDYEANLDLTMMFEVMGIDGARQEASEYTFKNYGRI